MEARWSAKRREITWRRPPVGVSKPGRWTASRRARRRSANRPTVDPPWNDDKSRGRLVKKRWVGSRESCLPCDGQEGSRLNEDEKQCSHQYPIPSWLSKITRSRSRPDAPATRDGGNRDTRREMRTSMRHTVKQKARDEEDANEDGRKKERERERENKRRGLWAKQLGKRGKKESTTTTTTSIQRTNEPGGEACGFGQPVGSPSAGIISGPWWLTAWLSCLGKNSPPCGTSRMPAQRLLRRVPIFLPPVARSRDTPLVLFHRRPPNGSPDTPRKRLAGIRKLTLMCSSFWPSCEHWIFDSVALKNRRMEQVFRPSVWSNLNYMWLFYWFSRSYSARTNPFFV